MTRLDKSRLGLLFLIFINDLPDSVKESFNGLFCDDTLISKEIINQSDSNELQNDLNNVLEWSKMWGMRFNVEKCNQITLTNKRKPFKTKYYLGNETLSKKESIKYLGVIIDNKLSFKQHIQEKTRKATKVLNMLRRNLHFAPK